MLLTQSKKEKKKLLNGIMRGKQKFFRISANKEIWQNESSFCQIKNNKLKTIIKYWYITFRYQNLIL